MNWDWEKLQEKRQRQSRGTNSGGGAAPPDFDKLKNFFGRFRNMKASGLVIIIVIVVLLWLGSGFYIVNPDEVGVVKRFGAYTRMTQSGPHYHLPYPIETVMTPNVTQIRRLELGFRSSEAFDKGWRPVEDESLMLTGDENIVNVQCIVQYRIKNAEKYLFNIAQQKKAVKDAISAAMRQVVGRHTIDSALTTGKAEIQDESQKLVQEILDSYNSGIDVTAVKLQDVHPPEQTMEAFKEVASAREDKSRFINEARAYRNNIIPNARGKAAALLNEAKGFKESKIRQAQGESQRFLDVLKEYRQAKEVTRKRLYLETLEEIFSQKDIEKVLIPSDLTGKMLPLFSIDQLSQFSKTK
jgi:membrane protease subunit HflK